MTACQGALLVLLLAVGSVQADTWVWGEPTGYAPQPRFEHTATRIGKELVVLGGTLSNDVREADLHSLNVDTMRWSKPVTTGNTPGPSMGHSTVLIGDKLYSLFGSNGRTMSNRVYRLDTTSYVWERVVAKGRVPTPRAYHSTVASEGEILVFGGFDGRFYLNDLHMWKPVDPTTNATGLWRKVEQKGVVPEVRASAATALHGRKMYLFGGFEVSIYKNDFFVLDIDTVKWSRVHLSTRESCEMPGARAMASMTLVGTRLVLFGGTFCHSSGNCTELNDVHNYEIYKSTFTSSPATGLLPPARYGHTANLIGSKIVVFGGVAWPNLFNDVFQYDVYDNSWSIAPGLPPYAMKQHSMHAFAAGPNSTDPTLVVFGGKHGSGAYSHATHLYNIGTSTWSHPTAKGAIPPAVGHHASVLRDTTLYLLGGFNGSHSNNDLYSCDVLTASWSKIDVEGDKPPAMHGHAVVSGPTDLIQFGGVDCTGDECTFFNEVYSLSLDSLTWKTVATKGSGPRPRASHSLTTLSPYNHYMFGGIGPYFTNYDDLYLLDEASMSWQFVSAKGFKPSARYGHTAVPYKGKLLVFGGATCRSINDCTYLNDVYMFTPQTSTWASVPIQGDAVAPRVGAASAMVGEYLYTFGGSTHDKIYGELFTVGPEQVDPAKTIVYGPGTVGGTVARNVKFFVQLQDTFGVNRTTGGNSVEVEVIPTSRLAIAKLKDEDIEVFVEDSQQGQYKVEFSTLVSDVYKVSVTVDGFELPSFTTDIAADVPSVELSNAAGAGLTKCRAGQECSFIVNLVDQYGNRVKRQTPLDVQFTGPKPMVKTVKDVADGSPRVLYTPVKAGEYKVAIRIRAQEIPSSPWNLTITHGAPSPLKSRVSGAGLSLSEAGKKGEIVLTLMDEFENPILIGDDNVKAELIGPDELACAVVDNGNGVYDISYTAIKLGDYKLNIVLNDEPVQGAPFSVYVGNAPISPALTFAYGEGVRYSVAGYRSYFTIQSADDFGNNMTTGGAKFSVLYVGFGQTKQVADVTDHGDGRYTVSYVSNTAGDFMISATLWSEESGYQSIHASPFMGQTVAAGADPKNSYVFTTDQKTKVVKGEKTLRVVMGVHNYFKIQAVDRYGNLKNAGGDKFTAELEGPVSHDAFVSDKGDGTYVGTFVAPAAGRYWLKVYYGDVMLEGMPLGVLARPNFDNCPNGCSERGQCIDSTCLCHAGYAGDDCSIEIGNCPDNCNGNGACLNSSCVCYPGFSGPSCADSIVLCPNDCSNHGVCHNAACICDDGYAGVDCGDNTATCPDACMGNGECVNGTCLCYPGFRGANCAQKGKFCPKACSGRGTCSSNGMCSCFSGWTGLDCAIQSVDETVLSQQKRSGSGSLPALVPSEELPSRLPRKH